MNTETVHTRACGIMDDPYQDDDQYRLVKANALGRTYEVR